MSFKAGILILTLFIGSYAEDDMSIYFDHTDESARIVGGSTAGSVPHMVAMVTGTISRSLLCGGSLVTNRHVLTAAHCITPVQSGGDLVSSLRGIVGTNRFSSGGTQIVFARGIIHPNWNSSTIKNDMGILISTAKIDLSNSIRLVTMSNDWAGAGVATSTSGWGRTTAGGSMSQVLITLKSLVIDGGLCKTEVARRAAELNMTNVPSVDPNLEICTFHFSNQRIYNGDSGSALVRRDNGRQIGIVSWGLPSARNIGMFARVSANQPWILQNLR